jgi:hypothetical protein
LKLVDSILNIIDEILNNFGVVFLSKVHVLKKSPTLKEKRLSKKPYFTSVSAIRLVQTGLYMGKGFAPPPQ